MSKMTRLSPIFSDEVFQSMCEEIYGGSYAFQEDPGLTLSLIDYYDPYEDTLGADPDDPEGVESLCWEKFFDDHSVDIQDYIRETYSDPLFVLG